MSGVNEKRIEREKYYRAFAGTLVKIWQEKIVLLNAIRSGELYRSIATQSSSADADYLKMEFVHKFLKYGFYVNYGTGSNTRRGNPGDIGMPNRRKAKRWFSTKYYASMMNIRDFLAKNVGEEYCNIVSNALNASMIRHFDT